MIFQKTTELVTHPQWKGKSTIACLANVVDTVNDRAVNNLASYLTEAVRVSIAKREPLDELMMKHAIRMWACDRGTNLEG